MTSTGAPLSLFWWYEHLLSLDDDIDPRVVESLGEMATESASGQRMPASVMARIYLRALRPGRAGAPPAAPVTSESALEYLNLLSVLATTFASEFNEGVDARQLRPAPGLVDELLVFLLSCRLAATVRAKKKGLAPNQVAQELGRLAEEAGLDATVLGGAGLQTK
jgi:hypothetical protein